MIHFSRFDFVRNAPMFDLSGNNRASDRFIEAIAMLLVEDFFSSNELIFDQEVLICVKYLVLGH
jgi:hypothetical protein